MVYVPPINGEKSQFLMGISWYINYKWPFSIAFCMFSIAFQMAIDLVITDKVPGCSRGLHLMLLGSLPHKCGAESKEALSDPKTAEVREIFVGVEGKLN